MTRAEIKIKDAISTKQPPAALAEAAGKALTSVRLRQARTSPCALSAAEAMKKAIDDVTGGPSCTAGGEACATAAKGAIEKAFADTVTMCRPESGPAYGFDPVAATEQEFKNLVVAGGAKVITGESTLANTPLTRFSYGLMGGLLVGHPRIKEPRVKVENGKIVSAPMDHALTIVVVNMHPAAYDAEWPVVSMAERFRFFGGAVLTPDFGATVGAGFGIVRGLSINIGVALLRIA